MRVSHIPADEEVREARKQKYLELWPETKQLEAFTEFFAGRDEKLNQLLKDCEEVRKGLPFLNSKLGGD